MQALGDCRDLTFDECGGDAPFDTLKNIGEAACQVFFFFNFNFEKNRKKSFSIFFSSYIAVEFMKANVHFLSMTENKVFVNYLTRKLKIMLVLAID